MEAQLIYSIFGSVLMPAVLFAIYFYNLWQNTKKANAGLEIQKNNFETISKKANDIILTIDIITGKIYNANLQAAETLAYPIAELCEKTIFDLYPKELLNLSAQTIAEVWEKKGLVYQNLPFLTAKGELLDVESSAKVLVYNYKPVIVIYARDIRERLRLEREILDVNKELKEKNKNITDSITYASRIQNAVFGNPEQLNAMFNDAFVFFKPHSIVSGDFYWFYQKNQYNLIIAADCTGHGVPGAFMTLMAHNFLEEIMNENVIMPDNILMELDRKVSKNLNRANNRPINDGMDMAILCIDKNTQKAYYAGANNPLCIVRNKTLEIVKASKHAVGGLTKAKIFDIHTFDLIKNDVLYIYSDGFQDQFGGKYNRKIMSKNFRNLLLEISEIEMHEQKRILEDTLNQWKGNNHQTDDILVIGVRI